MKVLSLRNAEFKLLTYYFEQSKKIGNIYSQSNEIHALSNLMDSIINISGVSKGTPLGDIIPKDRLKIIFYSDNNNAPLNAVILKYILGLDNDNTDTADLQNSITLLKGLIGFYFTDDKVCRIQHSSNTGVRAFIYEESVGSVKDWIHKTIYEILQDSNSDDCLTSIEIPYSILEKFNNRIYKKMYAWNVESCILMNENCLGLPSILSDIVEDNSILFIPCFKDVEDSELPDLIEDIFEKTENSSHDITDLQKYDFYTRIKPIVVGVSENIDEYDEDDAYDEDDEEYYGECVRCCSPELYSTDTISKDYPFYVSPTCLHVKYISAENMSEIVYDDIEKHLIYRSMIYLDHLKDIVKKIDTIK